ncbi:MAG: 3'-5' exonuclease domain-containing protein 2 [Culturomica sp.]|jgi:ribonuclease D|nr:3'-5' exonuclease domain-containing protein 2 [Culturomica sp.]
MKIEKEEIYNLPLWHYDGNIVLIDNQKDLNKIIKKIKSCEELGFDTETRPAFKKGEIYKVSLLQLATDEEVYLFRLNKCGFPSQLQQLLANKKNKKIGVGLRDDLKKLPWNTNYSPAGFIDLQNLAEHYGIEDKSFVKLMAIIFHVHISKRQQTSNWERTSLSEEQMIYAATDAWGALKMYQELQKNWKEVLSNQQTEITNEPA